MTHPLVRAVRAALARRANPVRARHMQAYMKSALPFRGVPSPQQRSIYREIFAAHPLETFDEWRRVALELWRGAAFREERYAAFALTDARRYRSFRTIAALPMFEEMIVTGAWWDHVDAVATHSLGDVLRADPRRMKPLLRTWARGGNMWKRRAAILCQIRSKDDTDATLLFECIEPSLAARGSSRPTVRSEMAAQFFIRKAIGWALRQYARTHPGEVLRYVAANRSRLSPLSVREALKHMPEPVVRRFAP